MSGLHTHSLAASMPVTQIAVLPPPEQNSAAHVSSKGLLMQCYYGTWT